MDFSKLIAGQIIEYIGDSLAFDGVYTLVAAESTYANPDTCPEYDKGKLMIIEFMNDETPMFFTLDGLNPNEWQIVNR